MTDVIPLEGERGEKMESEDRITLRLEKENLELIDNFLKENPAYRNRSQLCREAVQAFIDTATRSGDQVTLKVPRFYLELMDHLVNEGYFLDREHAVLRCVEAYFSKERVKEIEEHRRETGKATGKIVSLRVGDKDEVIQG